MTDLTEEQKQQELEAKKLEQDKLENEKALAEAKKTENMIPQSRFNEKIEELKEAKLALEALQKVQKEDADKKLVENQKWEERSKKQDEELGGLRPKAEKVDELEKTLERILEAQIETIPEHLRSLIPEGTAQFKLDYISDNKSLLTQAKGFNVGEGKKGGSETKSSVALTDEQKKAADKAKISHEDYANNLTR